CMVRRAFGDSPAGISPAHSAAFRCLCALLHKNEACIEGSPSACLAWGPIFWQGHASRRGLAQSGSAAGFGPQSRRFKSCCPDQFHHHKNLAAELTASTVLAETGTLDARFDLAPHRACGSRSNNRQAGTKRKPSAASCKSPKVWMTLIASLDRATV